MLIKEIMTTEVVTVTTEDSVEKCANILLENNFSGVPVLDEQDKLVGIITEGDLIRRASRIKAPPYLEVLGGLIYLGNPQKFVAEIKKAMSLKAGELMTSKVITAHPEDSVEKAATLMIENEVRRLPVLDDTGNLAGIVSRRDIMHQLYQNEHYS